MSAALIVIDMLNPYEHEDASPLMRSVADAVPSISELVAGAVDAGQLTVYVNDNHGDWTAGRRELTRKALRGAAPELVEPIAPPDHMPLWSKRGTRSSTRPSSSTCSARRGSSASSSPAR
jgi:nicotinamidase-related amidase